MCCYSLKNCPVFRAFFFRIFISSNAHGLLQVLGRFSSFNSLLVCIGSVQPSKPWRSGKRAQVCGSVGTVKRTKPRTLR